VNIVEAATMIVGPIPLVKALNVSVFQALETAILTLIQMDVKSTFLTTILFIVEAAATIVDPIRTVILLLVIAIKALEIVMASIKQMDVKSTFLSPILDIVEVVAMFVMMIRSAQMMIVFAMNPEVTLNVQLLLDVNTLRLILFIVENVAVNVE